MDTILKLINSALGIPSKTSLLSSSRTLVIGEPDNSTVMPTPENQQNETLSDSSFIKDNSEKNTSPDMPGSSEDSTPSNTPVKYSKDVRLNIDFSDNGLIQGFIMSEILAPPKAMKRRGNTLWNSRF